MNLVPSRFLRRCGATSGVSALCLSLCLGLWSVSSSSASELTPEQVQEAVYDGVFAALTTAPISFNQGAVNTVPWLFPSFEGRTLGEWLLYNFGDGDREPTFHDMLEELLSDTDKLDSDLLSEMDKLDSRLSSGLLTGAQRELLLTWLSDIQLWGEASYTANGFRTSTEAGSNAWSVRDEDANSLLERMHNLLLDILNAMDGRTWDGLKDIISGGVIDAYEYMSDVEFSDQTDKANSALEGIRAIDIVSQGENVRAEQTTEWALDDLINDEHSALPFLEHIPDLNEIENAPTRTISRPDDTPYVEDWVLVEGGFRLVDEELAGSIPFPEIVLKRSATVTESSRPFIQWGGRITSAIWGLAFGVWILHVARSDWAFYVSGGGSDATMLAEQMEARRCLDINAALFSDSSVL